MQANQNTSRVSFRDEREFGLIVGFMLILVGSWWLYHNKWKTVATGFLVVGSVLVALGLLIPKALVIPNRAWMSLARGLSLITTPVFMGIVFFMLFMPIGVFKRLFGWDPLRRRAPSASSYWHVYNERHRDTKHFEKMY